MSISFDQLPRSRTKKTKIISCKNVAVLKTQYNLWKVLVAKMIVTLYDFECYRVLKKFFLTVK